MGNGLSMVISVVTLLVSLSSVASNVIELPTARTLKIVYKASKRFGVDSQDLLKIAFLESSFKETAVRVNKNGTIDLGMFQINSVHWSTTCKAFDIFTLEGNAYCAAKLVKLAKEGAREDDEHWIGRYHSKTPSLKVAYANKVQSVNLIGGSRK